MSEEKVGPHGEPIAVGHFNEVPINRLVRADGGEISYAELRHWAACVNALHAAGLTPEQVRTIYGLQFAAERAEEVLSDSVRDEVPPEDDECIAVRDLLRAALADLRKQA